ncbi:MAG: methyltransferase domain-containing protein [Paenibacillaceae bacterium]|nr:methyltransferase domain-containing protein [Paenibacillaceae bacterium]
MSFEQWKEIWLEEQAKTFAGWDFSAIANRTAEEPLPWDYRSAVKRCMQPSSTVLDMCTGGGEFLLSLDPPRGRTYATESYAPNVDRCLKTLPLHGIDVRQVYCDDELPFEDRYFDLVINRHGVFAPREVFRILKPGGTLITQQVGGQNNRELATWLLGREPAIVDPDFNLAKVGEQLRSAGFQLTEAREYYPTLSFYDVGALVYFAKVIEWEFPGFSVQACLDKLFKLQAKVDRDGVVTSRGHRFLLVAAKCHTPQ